MVEQSWWNSNSGTVTVEQVMVEQSWWNIDGGTVIVEQWPGNSHAGTVKVKQ